MSERGWEKSKSKWRSMREDQRATREGKKDYVPKVYNDSGAGKGDQPRNMDITQEEYGLRYDLATGRISIKEFDIRIAELNDNTMGSSDEDG